MAAAVVEATWPAVDEPVAVASAGAAAGAAAAAVPPARMDLAVRMGHHLVRRTHILAWATSAPPCIAFDLVGSHADLDPDLDPAASAYPDQVAACPEEAGTHRVCPWVALAVAVMLLDLGRVHLASRQKAYVGRRSDQVGKVLVVRSHLEDLAAGQASAVVVHRNHEPGLPCLGSMGETSTSVNLDLDQDLAPARMDLLVDRCASGRRTACRACSHLAAEVGIVVVVVVHLAAAAEDTHRSHCHRTPSPPCRCRMAWSVARPVRSLAEILLLGNTSKVQSRWTEPCQRFQTVGRSSSASYVSIGR